MASGSAGRGIKAYDFGSDDILCSYEDYGTQDANNAHSDPSIAANSAKEFHKSRAARTSVIPATTYSPPEESSFNQGVISTVEDTVKKYTDNVMLFLEGISSRLSKLELYCYNLDKSIGEMRSDLVRDHEESESKLKSLEKHVQEVHRSVQILRDKQELSDTQKELAKLQLAQKESSSAKDSQQNEDRASTPATEAKKSDNSSNMHDQQLALVPNQAAPQPSLPARPIEHQQNPMASPSSVPSQSMPLSHAYYLPAPKTTNVTSPSLTSLTQYLPALSQVQDHSGMATPPQQSQVNQGQHVQSVPPYPQQWPLQQQLPNQPPQQPVMQPQIKNSTQIVYSNYLPGQPNQFPAEMAPNSMPVQVPYGAASQAGAIGPEPIPYGLGHGARPIHPQPPTQHIKTGYGKQSGDSYVPSGPRPAVPPGNAYVMFDGEGGRTQHPPQPHFQQSAYPPTSFPLPNPQRVPSANVVSPHSVRSHPYNELIEKLVGMGYRGEHAIAVIQRLEESGQPVDFNSVLDRMNGHAALGSQRGWSS